MQAAKVQWYCASPTHRAPAAELADRLTIHLGEWAFCPSDTKLPEHDWRRTGGLPVELAGARLTHAFARAGKV
jgi:hypothetical protein